MTNLAYVTDQQAAAILAGLGLPPQLTLAQAQINDGQALYLELLARPWATDADLAQWAVATWGDTDGSRLAQALALLERAGRMVGIPLDWQPFPTASTGGSVTVDTPSPSASS